jgi:hypothetical protein
MKNVVLRSSATDNREFGTMRQLLLMIPLVAFAAGASLLAESWPHWRGPSQNGVSAETGLPVSWGAECGPDSPVPVPAPPPAAVRAGRGSDAAGRGNRRRSPEEGRPLNPLTCADVKTANIAWKIPLPAYSGSTPIVWGDLIFLNVATAANSGDLELWAIDRRTQSVAWKRGLADGNHMERKQNMSSPSPVTDGP